MGAGGGFLRVARLRGDVVVVEGAARAFRLRLSVVGSAWVAVSASVLSMVARDVEQAANRCDRRRGGVSSVLATAAAEGCAARMLGGPNVSLLSGKGRRERPKVKLSPPCTPANKSLKLGCRMAKGDALGLLGSMVRCKTVNDEKDGKRMRSLLVDSD